MEVRMLTACCRTCFAGLDADAQYVVGEVAGVGERRGRVFAYLGTLDRLFDTLPQHVDIFFFEASVETIFASRLAFVDAVQEQ